jgi:dihydrofolate reductase
MIISLIVAMDQAGGIGKDGGLPWHLPADLKRFKALTMGHHLIVGRKTHETIGRPLPGRTTIVLTRDLDYRADGCLVAASLDEALELARQRGEDEAFVIGGAQVYDEALPLADRIYLTGVHGVFEADVYFPQFDLDGWTVKESLEHPADKENPVGFTFTVLNKIDAG